MSFRVSGATGGLECPKCRFTMEPLRDSNLIDRDEGYLLDTTTSSDWVLGWYVFGLLDDLIARFVYYVVDPLAAKLWGSRTQKYYRRVLRRFPNALVCPNCRYLVRDP